MSPSPTRPARPEGASLSLAENVCLALIAAEPQHGWSLAAALRPDSELGSVWSLSRALVYRAVDQLESKQLVVREPGETTKGANRLICRATDRGRTRAEAWLHEPVHHVRDIRTEFLVKATMLRPRGNDLLGLIVAQEAVLAPVLESLRNDRSETTPAATWRRESAAATQRFLKALRFGATGSVHEVASLPSLSTAPSDETRTARPFRFDLSEQASALRRAGHDAVVARTIELRGFGPQRPGELAIITDDRLSGRILNGASDDTLLAAARQLVASRHAAAAFGCSIGGGIAARHGLTCGGTAEILLQRLDTLPELFWGDAIGAPRSSLTRLHGERAGATLTITALGERAGTLGDEESDNAALETATGQMRWSIGGVSIVEDLQGQLLLDVVWAMRRLIIVGAGELAVELASLATRLGWSTYTTEVVSEAVTYLADATPSDALIVLSHNPTIDAPVLTRALRSAVGYVGALGSRRTQTARRQRLIDGGVADKHLAQLRGPAGLDIGAAGPSEVAVSIIAEIVAVRSGRDNDWQRQSESPDR